MLVVTLHENINKLTEKVCESDYENEPVPNTIPEPYTKQDNPKYKIWGWDGIEKKAAGNCPDRDSRYIFGE